MKPLEAKTRLRHIEKAAETVLRYTAGKTYEDYEQDEILVDAVEREFITVGEALNKAIQEDPALKITNAPRVIAFRNQLIHNYSAIEASVVWNLIHEHLPLLLTEVRALLAEP